jgi:hypothetical protein
LRTTGAFSREGDIGSREDNASTKDLELPFRLLSERNKLQGETMQCRSASGTDLVKRTQSLQAIRKTRTVADADKEPQ